MLDALLVCHRWQRNGDRPVCHPPGRQNQQCQKHCWQHPWRSGAGHYSSLHAFVAQVDALPLCHRRHHHQPCLCPRRCCRHFQPFLGCSIIIFCLVGTSSRSLVCLGIKCCLVVIKIIVTGHTLIVVESKIVSVCKIVDVSKFLLAVIKSFGGSTFRGCACGMCTPWTATAKARGGH